MPYFLIEKITEFPGTHGEIETETAGPVGAVNAEDAVNKSGLNIDPVVPGGKVTVRAYMVYEDPYGDPDVHTEVHSSDI